MPLHDDNTCFWVYCSIDNTPAQRFGWRFAISTARSSDLGPRSSVITVMVAAFGSDWSLGNNLVVDIQYVPKQNRGRNSSCFTLSQELNRK
ncbi:468_t:CDS:2 [Ambispora gerdemannii]|uniref:468_t:CDS:1 n=1 Tax=Ambispora gerdemannii TaxID=144530 RepID=A0A9N9CUB2_9GLOM|nr:468_t:CDS:2 [Ambispora gerdemannii]